MATKKRLDLLLEEKGLCSSRQLARTAIMDGAVLVNGEKITKAGAQVRDDANIELTGAWRETKKFVSRGGLKLEKALDLFGIDVTDRICLDVGASTGGFTDCLLKRGAKLVYAVDVGYGQLDWSLRSDSRVVVRERINARSMSSQDLYGADNNEMDSTASLKDAQDIDEKGNESSDPAMNHRASLAVMDLSFISAVKVLPAVIACLSSRSDVVALIKPQFEAGPNLVGKGGVVRSAATHAEVLNKVLTGCAELGLNLIALTHSPVKGPAGNIEFLAYWCTKKDAEKVLQISVAECVKHVVDAAHSELSDAADTSM